MTEVELKLITNNQSAVKGIREMITETQKLYDFASQGSKKLISNIDKEKFVYQELIRFKKNATAADKLLYDQQIAASRKRIEVYQKEGKEIENTGERMSKSGGGFASAIKGWALGLGTISAAVTFIKSGINSTESSFEKFEQVMALGKGAFQGFWSAVLAGDWAGLKDSIMNTAAATRELAIAKQELEHIQNSEEIKKGFAERRLQNAREMAAETTDAKLREQYFQEAISSQEKVTEITTDLIKQRMGVAEEFFKSQIASNDKWKNYTIEQFRTVAGQYNYLFATIDENGKKREMTGQQMAEITLAQLEERKRLLGTLTTEEENQRRVLHNSVLAMRDFVEVSGKMKPDQFELWVKDVGLLNNAIADGDKALVRLKTQLTRAETKDNSGLKKGIDEALKIKEDYQKTSQKLIDEHSKSNIESLSGVDKLKAQRDLGLKGIKDLRDELTKVGTITPAQENMLTELGANVGQAYKKGLEKEAKNTPPQLLDIRFKLKEEELLAKLKDLNDQWVIAPTFDRIALAKEIKDVEFQIDELNKEKVIITVEYKQLISQELAKGLPDMNKLAPGPKFQKPSKPETLWSLFGIDTSTDEGQKAVDALKETVSTMSGVMDEIYQKRVDDAQRNRELLDTKISEAQSSLDQEIDLYKAGYASNVDAKKKELEDLKKQRELALKKEEEALKKQRALDTIQQISSLITASAQIFKSLAALGPIGIGLAIATIATMFTAFAATKIKASAASQYAEGGWTGEGKERDSSGQRIAGIVHGEEFVIKKGPAGKFRDVLEAINRDDKKMIFNSFNKLDPALLGGTTINNVVVENTGPNKRLDQVNRQLEKLNKNKEQVYESGNSTIIIKGQSYRIIKR